MSRLTAFSLFTLGYAVMALFGAASAVPALAAFTAGAAVLVRRLQPDEDDSRR